MNPLSPINPSVTELTTTLFPQTSRYYGAAVRKLDLPNGKQVAYIDRRFVPQRDRFATLHEHAVADSDRPDTVAARYLGDAEQFWRLADANYDLNPFDLTATPNRRLRITLPEGVPPVPQIT
jgi:hypothetical protein